MTKADASLPKALADKTLEQVVSKLRLDEVHDAQGKPLMTLTSAMSPDPVGHVRVFQGEPLHQLVTVALTVPQIHLDSHMLFAFMPADSPLPHFTLDSVFGGFYAFHLDLIPRVDLGANLAYMDSVFKALSDTWGAAKELEGLEPARLTPRQLALMSPWMLAYRASEQAFKQIDGFVTAYLEQWFALLDRGLPDDVLGDIREVDLAARDRRNKHALFNPDVDPVWSQVTRLLGEETSTRIQEILKGGANSTVR